VHSSHQFYRCFGCGQSGDLFKFVMEIERISFFEALKLVAERNGIAMPKREYSDPDAKLRGALMEMHETAARVFQSNLNGPAGAQARQYLASRNVTPEQIAEFGLGLSDLPAISWSASLNRASHPSSWSNRAWLPSGRRAPATTIVFAAA
jgi:DNA primase